MSHLIRIRRYLSACKKRAPFATVLLMLLALAPGSGARAGVGNFLCTSNSCGVDSTPIYINIYWDSSLDQWDVDVAASSTEMQHVAHRYLVRRTVSYAILRPAQPVRGELGGPVAEPGGGKLWAAASDD